MSMTEIQKVRVEVGDTDIHFPLLEDETYAYFLEKNNQNIGVSALDAAKAILFLLSTRNSETVDIFSIKNSSAESYRQALLLYIKNPSLNPMMQNMTMYVGGISKSDIEKNKLNPDNKIIIPPDCDRPPYHRFPFGWTIS